jgi:hypothetical protein
MQQLTIEDINLKLNISSIAIDYEERFIYYKQTKQISYYIR